MRGQRALNVALLALTGFGNTVLEALLEEARVTVGAVFTGTYDNPFPYYPERQLAELCEERRVRCYHDLDLSNDEGQRRLRQLAPDLIIVATFKQILSDTILSLPPLGVVNVHPSLLPRYRGPCPTNAALWNDDASAGVTVHFVGNRLDAGDILLQSSIAIDTVENDGQLRQILARLAGTMVPDLIEMFANFAKPSGRSQDHKLASRAPRPTVEDGYLERAGDIDTIRRKMRAFNPLPGTSFLIGNRRIAVERFALIADQRPSGLYECDNAIDVVAGSQAIRLFKKGRKARSWEQ